MCQVKQHFSETIYLVNHYTLPVNRIPFYSNLVVTYHKNTCLSIMRFQQFRCLPHV